MRNTLEFRGEGTSRRITVEDFPLDTPREYWEKVIPHGIPLYPGWKIVFAWGSTAAGEIAWALIAVGSLGPTLEVTRLTDGAKLQARPQGVHFHVSLLDKRGLLGSSIGLDFYANHPNVPGGPLGAYLRAVGWAEETFWEKWRARDWDALLEFIPILEVYDPLTADFFLDPDEGRCASCGKYTPSAFVCGHCGKKLCGDHAASKDGLTLCGPCLAHFLEEEDVLRELEETVSRALEGLEGSFIRKAYLGYDKLYFTLVNVEVREIGRPEWRRTLTLGVEVDLEELARVKMGEADFSTDEVIRVRGGHPHVSLRGKVCFGSFDTEQLKESLLAGDILTFAGLLKAFLSQYNHEDAFDTLYDGEVRCAVCDEPFIEGEGGETCYSCGRYVCGACLERVKVESGATVMLCPNCMIPPSFR